MNIESLLSPELIELYVIPWIIRIVMALVVFIIGRWIAKLAVRMTEKMMTKASMDSMLTGFMGNILYAILLLAVIIAALDQLGIQTTSLLAVFGAPRA